MTTLSIPDMHCNACKASVERALQSFAPEATVLVDLDQRRATICGTADTAAMIAALDRIGFPAEPLPT